MEVSRQWVAGLPCFALLLPFHCSSRLWALQCQSLISADDEKRCTLHKCLHHNNWLAGERRHREEEHSAKFACCPVLPCHRSKQDLSHANSVNRDLLGRCLRLTEVLVDFVVDQGQQGGQLQGQLAHLFSEVQDVQHCSLRDALQVGRGIPWW
jgi:hypothetical protein